jgi:hypothetical protein
VEIVFKGVRFHDTNLVIPFGSMQIGAPLRSGPVPDGTGSE